MGFIDDIGSFVGGLFGGGTVGSPTETAQVGGGLFSDSAFYKGLLEAGLGLAQVYAQQSQEKKLAEEYMKQKQAEFAYQKEMAEKALAAKGGGGGGGGSARQALLASLYSNYANAMADSGNAFAKNTNEVAANISAPISIRAGRLI